MPLPESSLRLELEQAYASGMALPEHLEPHLASAIHATLARPGSMVRAMLAWQMARATGLDAEGQRGRQLAIAMEYFHTAALVFDDLPAMDDATSRRGVPCVHQRFGEGAAMLAALALINRAYGMIWSAAAGLPLEQQQAGLRYVEQHLGVGGLLQGQSLDLHYAQARSAHSPQNIAVGKTVSLIRLPLVLPAILGGSTSRMIERLERIAVLWGLAYQSLDDLKDVLHTGDACGKTARRDALLERPNLALECGLDAACMKTARQIRLAAGAVRRLVAAHPEFVFLASMRLQLDAELNRLLVLHSPHRARLAALALAS